MRLPLLAAIFSFALAGGPSAAHDEGTLGRVGSQLTVDNTAHFWTENRIVPMCWHILQFPSLAEQQAAQALVTQTIKDGWIDPINLRVTWEDCPTSGDAKHVRVLLRSGDPTENGTTLRPGTLTLSTAADPNDPPGLLMGFLAT